MTSRISNNKTNDTHGKIANAGVLKETKVVFPYPMSLL